MFRTIINKGKLALKEMMDLERALGKIKDNNEYEKHLLWEPACLCDSYEKWPHNMEMWVVF